MGSSAFYGCSSLRHIALPAGITSVGNYAFYDCPQMETLVVYAMKTQFGNDAIRDVPLLTIYGWNNSDAILYAIQNGIPFELIGESGDYSGYIVDMAQTSFTADASSLEAGQTVTFTLHYVLKTPLPSNLDELRLTVGLSNTLDADLSSVRLNGSVVEDATLDGSLLTVPVSSGVTSGTLVFSAEASGTNASAFAQMLYSVNDTEKADTLGTLEIDGSAFVGGYSYALLEKTAAGATVLLHNGQSQSDEILVILAAYGEDGHMLCVKVQELAVSAGENVTLTLPLTADDPVSTLKAFTVRPGTYSPLRSAWAYHFAG